MRAAPWIYGIPNAVRSNLLWLVRRGGRKRSRGAGASLYKLLPGEGGGGEDHHRVVAFSTVLVVVSEIGKRNSSLCFYSQKSYCSVGNEKVEMLPLRPVPFSSSSSSSSHETFVFLVVVVPILAWISPIFIPVGQLWLGLVVHRCESVSRDRLSDVDLSKYRGAGGIV